MTDRPAEHFRHAYTRDRAKLLNRLRRIEGQARGIQRLVEEEAYCLDVLQQVEALTAAADQVGMLVLEDHIAGCLSHAIEAGEGEPYVEEVMAVVRRAVGRRPTPRRADARARSGSAAGGNHGTPA
ncbi:MAG TPA: metal-sensitive transcriptional regulator [Candidatus Limnocylindria bacterium]|nr:metal-sensitive transcriptional regulator [Candidatus Limnocylindria bacterium]